MGDEFSWYINTFGVGGFDLGNEPTEIWGLKLDTGLGLRFGTFFIQGQLEVGGGEGFQSPLGVDSFDALAPFEYTLNAGLNFDDTFIIRVGRFHYERTELEGLLNRNGFQASANAANVAAPLGWPGAELWLQLGKESEILRSMLLNVSYYYGNDGSHMGILEGLATLALEDSEDAPTLTLAGFGTVRGNSPGAEFDVETSGTQYGQGGLASFEYGIFSATTGVIHRYGSFIAPSGPTTVEERFAATVGLGLEPSDFVFRAAYSFLSESFTSNLDFEPPQGAQESHWEITAGYRPASWLLLSLGYRGIRGENGDADQLFLGVQSTLEGDVPFELSPLGD